MPSRRTLLGKARDMPSPEIEERPPQATPQAAPPRCEELAHDYSINMFPLQWDQLMATRDKPTKMMRDQGSQLTASLNTTKINSLNREPIDGREAERYTAWELVPARRQSRAKDSKVTLNHTIFKMLR